ncbi:tetratricopeptide repeat protein [Spirosoma sp. SC4-14]|uniref:tetratricopeptide repeat protein n=1 Tax=Spirosoma sp. SC4-14 TaxID=3128900 RepID=UPI0030CD7131
MNTTDLETIENYVNGQLSAEERATFEQALRSDPAVADALAFYIMSKQAAQEQARQQRMAEFDALRQQQPALGQRPLGSWITYAAAASIVILLGLGWYFFGPTSESTVAENQFVDTYVATHFAELPTTMDGRTDSLKLGVDLFNKGKLAEAGVIFQDVLKRHPDTDSALKYAGIVSLRQGNYDQAIEQFHQLSQRSDLFSNPGLFYESLALLKRGQPMDKAKAKELLDEVIQKNLEGETEAEQIRATL